MPPPLLRLVIIRGAGSGILRAGPTHIRGVFQVYVDLARFQFQFYPLHLPRALDTKNATIQFPILHEKIVA